jgi:hypothetical protein
MRGPRAHLQEVLQIPTGTKLSHDDNLVLLLGANQQHCFVSTAEQLLAVAAGLVCVCGRLLTSNTLCSCTASGRDCTSLSVSTCTIRIDTLALQHGS